MYDTVPIMKTRATSVQDCDAILIDVDGTLWQNDEEIIPGAIDFLNALRHKKIPAYLLTNITRYKQSSITQLLAAQGALFEEHHAITATISAIRYLKQQGITTVYAIGTGELLEELARHDVMVSDSDAQAVVIGFDRQLSYEKLHIACRLVASGAQLVAIHNEAVYIKNGQRTPSIGATVAYIHAATEAEPMIVGKPSRAMVECALEITGVPAHRTAIIGDRMDSDMRMAEEFGMISVLVLSGHSTRDELAHFPYQPDYVVDSVANLIPLFS